MNKLGTTNSLYLILVFIFSIFFISNYLRTMCNNIQTASIKFQFDSGFLCASGVDNIFEFHFINTFTFLK